MSSRVAGAALALIAAALLAVSIATPVVLPAGLSLFAGNPTVDGHVRKSQNMYVGLYSAQLCNNGDSAGEDRGGEMSCKSGESQGLFHIIGFAELGATGLGLIAAIGLALSTLRSREGRKGWARVVRIGNTVGLAGAVGLIATHPVGASAAIPIGIGMILHAVGLVGGIAASVIAVRPPAPIKLRSSKPVAVPAQPQPQGIDMDALFHEDQLRPAEPAQGRGRRTDAPPFGPNAGSWHGQQPAQHPQPGQQQYAAAPPQNGGYAPAPFGINPGTQPGARADSPLFSSAPQLRPLYDATPMQGGTGGLMPFERPVLPSRAPTPVPRAMFEVDIDVEPSMMAPLPTAAQPHAPPMQLPPEQLPPEPPPARTKPQTLPPPMPAPRSRQMSAPPPTPAARPPLPFTPPASQPEPAIAVAPIIESSEAAELPSDTSASNASSDGRPEAPVASTNTEPTMLPDDDAPIEPPPPAKSASASGSVPAIPAAPAAPLPRPQRNTRQPMRASVPLPARPGRATMPTRPPPLRAGAIKSTIASPVVPPPAIPPIPGIPTVPTMPAFTLPPVTAQRAATEIVPELAAARVPVEITDNFSQTNVSGVPSDRPGPAALEDVAYAEAEALAGEPSDTAQGAAVRPSDTSPLGQPTSPQLTAQPPAVVPLGQPTAVAFPVPIALQSPAPSRAPKLPITTAPDSLPPPKDNRSQASGPSPACPQCEAPMAWVEEHLRFYCKSCRMYF